MITYIVVSYLVMLGIFFEKEERDELVEVMGFTVAVIVLVIFPITFPITIGMLIADMKEEKDA